MNNGPAQDELFWNSLSIGMDRFLAVFGFGVAFIVDVCVLRRFFLGWEEPAFEIFLLFGSFAAASSSTLIIFSANSGREERLSRIIKSLG